MVCIQINDQDYVMTREAGDSNHGAMQEDMQVDMDEVFNISTYLSPTTSGSVNVLLIWMKSSISPRISLPLAVVQ